MVEKAEQDTGLKAGGKPCSNFYDQSIIKKHRDINRKALHLPRTLST
jgi:hypothetical protein